MNQTNNSISQLFENVADYSITTAEIWKLKSIEILADHGSKVAIQLILVSVMSLFLLMLSIGCSFLLGDLLGKTAYGFFLTSFFYLIVAIVIYIIRIKRLKEPIRNSIIKGIFN